MASRALQANMDGGRSDLSRSVRDGGVRGQNPRVSFVLRFRHHLRHKISTGRIWACNFALIVVCLAAGIAGATLANRGQPFEFVHTYIKPEVVMPGGRFTIFLHQPEHHEGLSWLRTSRGHRFAGRHLAASRWTHRLLRRRRRRQPVNPHVRATPSRWTTGASPGPAVYRSHATFWCNVCPEVRLADRWADDGDRLLDLCALTYRHNH